MSSYNLTLNELIVKSRKHLLEMLQDRGFNTKKINSISDEELIKLFDKHKMVIISVPNFLSTISVKPYLHQCLDKP